MRTSGKPIPIFAYSWIWHRPYGDRKLGNMAKLWDAASGKLIASFDHQDVSWHGV